MLTRTHAVLVIVAAVATVGIATSASAHYKRPGQANDKYGQWYFTGMTYKDRPLNAENRKDPINVIFYGPHDGSPYTRDRIETHMKDDWSTRAVGGRAWSTDDEIWSVCKDDQYVGWPFYPGSDSDRTDWHGSTSARLRVGFTAKTACFAQHHLRMWDDYEHTKCTGAEHTANDWAVGGFHHEHPIGKIGVLEFPHVGHKIDRDWDRVRVEMTKGMRVHCSVRRWKYHPEADGVWQDYGNYGFIARVSLRHRDPSAPSQGCDGA